MLFESWKPGMSREDKLILKYLNEEYDEVGGIVFVEVIVGQGGVHKWPTGAKPRRIDAVLIPNSGHSDHNEIVIFKKE
jgi:hypothetical protein